jgi:hypothetical protein
LTPTRATRLVDNSLAVEGTCRPGEDQFIGHAKQHARLADVQNRPASPWHTPDDLIRRYRFFAIATGFAAKNIVESFMSGGILRLERIIRPGDLIVIGGRSPRADWGRNLPVAMLSTHALYDAHPDNL